MGFSIAHRRTVFGLIMRVVLQGAHTRVQQGHEKIDGDLTHTALKMGRMRLATHGMEVKVKPAPPQHKKLWVASIKGDKLGRNDGGHHSMVTMNLWQECL